MLIVFLLCTNRSSLCDAAHGAGISAGTAVDALVAVDGVVTERVVHIDRALGAGICTGTASDAAIVDNVHLFFLLIELPYSGFEHT